MAELLADKGYTLAFNYLWMHYFLEGNEKVAKETWVKYLAGKKLLFGYVLNVAHNKQDATICARLIDFLKSVGSEKSVIGYIYSALIEIYASRNDDIAVQQAIKNCIADDCYESIAKYTLPKIKKQFKSNGKDFVVETSV